uniref:Uncharacterized protein n=1 Tax=Setaria italica TaxID=4555 RepID=K3ZGH1_SETIT
MLSAPLYHNLRFSVIYTRILAIVMLTPASCLIFFLNITDEHAPVHCLLLYPYLYKLFMLSNIGPIARVMHAVFF